MSDKLIVDKSSKMPRLEFEGPMGFFWLTEDVPIEAIADAIGELFEEAKRRGFNERFVVDLLSSRKNLAKT